VAWVNTRFAKRGYAVMQRAVAWFWMKKRKHGEEKKD